VHTTWRTQTDPTQVLDLLQQRLTGADEVTGVERDGGTLVIRSRAAPTWAYLLSVVLTPLPVKKALLRARADKVLRITALAGDSGVQLDGDANAAVSTLLVTTAHELLPERVAELDEDGIGA
jgi:hypothetical protein